MATNHSILIFSRSIKHKWWINMKDFHSSLESAHKNPQDFTLASPPSEEELQSIRKLEQQEAQNEQDLREQSMQEALQDER